jgi:hypothetical protein
MNRSAGYTARTTAFATATGITDVTILGALNTFDLGLISNSLDTKMIAVYPFVGTTATTQKFNFMDARDLDVAFRLQFFGGGTFNSAGFLPNGTNAYGNTFFNVSGFQNNNHSSIFIASNKLENGSDMGVRRAANSNTIGSRFSDIAYIGNFLNGSFITFTNTNSIGFYVNTRTSSTSFKAFKNNALKGSDTTTSTDFSGSIYIGARNDIGNGMVEFYSSKQLSFSSIGYGLSDSESAILYTLVTNLQTALGR